MVERGLHDVIIIRVDELWNEEDTVRYLEWTALSVKQACQTVVLLFASLFEFLG